jgi:hypothetical protein
MDGGYKETRTEDWFKVALFIADNKILPFTSIVSFLNYLS